MPIHKDQLPRISALPSDPTFYRDPYAAYAQWHRQHSVFWWEAYGQVCFINHETVSALFRDRRFGREILHVASPEEVGMAETPAHVKPFYDFERNSMLEREPPVHTRLRRLVNRAFVSRQVERLRPAIAALSHSLIDGFSKRFANAMIAAGNPVTQFAGDSYNHLSINSSIGRGGNSVTRAVDRFLQNL